ncbi:MAG: DUF4390 domain-containing protein [Gammaproteobacteria bacterium]|nr:DUF4390 domain-containing protein [Gammaproteobacteria bacterium]
MFEKTLTVKTSVNALCCHQRMLFARFLLVCLMLINSVCVAAGFSIPKAEIALTDKVYHLSARLAFDFSDEVLQAINNGVPLVLVLDIELLKPREYLWDKEVATLEQRFQLDFHALSEQFVVRNLNSGAQFTFFSLTAALQKIGEIEQLPIIDEQLLFADGYENVFAKIRTRIAYETLPVPLRINALISSNWWLSSSWYTLNLYSTVSE